MNRRQRIIVSVTGIFIVLLILIGLTYAYFLTRITGNSNPTSISVTTANLELVYGDGTTSILTSSNPIEPGKFTASKDFTVTNNGDSTDYAVTLEDFSVQYAADTVIDGQPVSAGTVTKMEYPDDIKMEITCVIESDDETRNGKNCTNQITDGTLPTENSILLTNSIEVDDVHNYVLTLTYVESGTDQSADMNKTIKGKIDIIDPKSTIDLEGSVATYETGDYVEINSTPIKSEIVDGKYKLIGVEPGSHTLYVKYKDQNGNIQIRGSQTLTIKKGEEASVSGKTITISDESRTVTVDVNNNYQAIIEDEIKTLFFNKTISNALLTDSRIKKNYTTPEFNDIATSEEGMYKAEDDYGVSWYFRGAQSYNFVKFAGFMWRIVRINGDNTIRLILDGTIQVVKREGSNSLVDSTTRFFKTKPYNDNAYIGYMYGLDNVTSDGERCLLLSNGTITDKKSDSNYSTKELCEGNGGKWTTTAYEATQVNIGNSTVKIEVDKFYENYIENATKNYHYEKYLADNIFCGDKTLAKDGIGGVNKQIGYGGYDTGLEYHTYYAASERIQYSDGNNILTKASPTLKCAEGANDNFSRYTSTLDTSTTNSSGISVNNDLIHPIALLTVDEVVMAGELYGRKNNSHYLDEHMKRSPYIYSWWTMTPAKVAGRATMYYAGYNFGEFMVSNQSGVRPVINLKSDLLIKSGDGTLNTPYELMEIN